MSQIKVTNEISASLSKLRAAARASANFGQLQQLTFENTRFPSLTGYQTVIRTVGRLGERYRSTIERDISSCERVVENVRSLDQQVHQAIIAAM